MRRRVATTAALVSLCCCFLFAVLYNGAVRDNLLNDQINDLQRLCRVSAEHVDTAAFSESDTAGYETILEANGKFSVGTAFFRADGTLICANRFYPKDEVLNRADFQEALMGNTGVYKAVTRGRGQIFVTVQCDNGDILSLSEWVMGVTAITTRYTGPMVLLVIVLCALCFAVVMLLAHSNDRFSENTRYLLESFAEGRFDTRLKGIHGANARWADVINGYADRIERQVNRQSTRNQALSAVMNQMQTGLMAVNSDLNVILMTTVARSLLGVHEPPEGKPVSLMSRDVDFDGIFREAMGQQGVYVRDVAVHEGTNGRGLTPLKLYISTMSEAGKNVGAIAMIEDVTEIKRLEEVRNDFTANVSHELKTPLTSILGFVETLLDGAIDQPEMARKFLNIIMMETTRLSRLVNDILSISKLESGDTEVSTSRLQLDKMASDVCEILQPHARDKKVELTMNSPREPIYVWGNSDRLEQLVINLTENAIKYNREGGSVRVSVTGSDENAYFLVSDTGIGIAEEHLPRLFERFYRVDKGRSRAMGGTGLGLAIVKHIAVSMGGNVEVHSKLGEGSEFLVTLPRYFPEQTDVDQTPEEDE